jgi:hypothetical protein
MFYLGRMVEPTSNLASRRLTGSPNQMTMSLSVLQLDGTDADTGYCDDLAASQLPVHVSYLTGRSTDLAQPIPRATSNLASRRLTGSPNQMTMSLSVLQLDGTDAAEVFGKTSIHRLL